jgi:hypothetical protein
VYTTCTLYKVSFCSYGSIYGSSYNKIKVNKLNQHHKSLSKSKKHLKLRDTICANERCYLRLTPRRTSVIRISRALHSRQLRLLTWIVTNRSTKILLFQVITGTFNIMWSLRLRPLQRQWAPTRCRALSSFRSHGSRRGPRNSIQRPDIIQTSKKVEPSPQPEPAAHEPRDAYNPNYDPLQNTLLSPVHLPEDPKGVLKENHPAISILANSGVVVQRQLEMMNVMM